MREISFTEPHHHPEMEIYFILQGDGIVVVGGKEESVKKDSVIVIPSNVAHFTIPKTDLVLAMINTPPFNIENYHPLENTDYAVQFDRAQFDRLLCRRETNFF